MARAMMVNTMPSSIPVQNCCQNGRRRGNSRIMRRSMGVMRSASLAFRFLLVRVLAGRRAAAAAGTAQPGGADREAVDTEPGAAPAEARIVVAHAARLLPARRPPAPNPRGLHR